MGWNWPEFFFFSLLLFLCHMMMPPRVILAPGREEELQAGGDFKLTYNLHIIIACSSLQDSNTPPLYHVPSEVETKWWLSWTLLLIILSLSGGGGASSMIRLSKFSFPGPIIPASSCFPSLDNITVEACSLSWCNNRKSDRPSLRSKSLMAAS